MSKSEIRNSKQLQNSKFEFLKQRLLSVSYFEFQAFEFVSNFDIRISSLAL